MSALLILASTVTHISEGLFIKQYNKRHDCGGFAFTAFVSFFSMLFFLIVDRDGFSIPTELWWYGIAAGILYCSASFLTYVALQIGSYAMTMLILSYSVLMSIGYGLLFLNEQITAFILIGVLLMMISLYLVRVKKEPSDDDEKKGISLKWLICVGAATVGSGMFGVVQRMQQIRFHNVCTNEFMVIALSFSAATLMAVAIWKNRKDVPCFIRHGVFLSMGAGVSNGLTNASVVLLHMLMPISLSSPIRVGLKIVLSFLLSAFLLKEPFQKRQIFGVALGCVAVILLNV